jgi:hypothetical protein
MSSHVNVFHYKKEKEEEEEETALLVENRI